MSLPDAILFSFAALWLYLAGLLLWYDWRWYLGRSVEYLLFAAVTGALYAQARHDPAAAGRSATLAVALFFLFGVGASWAERRMLQAAALGQPWWPLTWVWLRLVLWGRGPWAVRRLALSIAALAAGDEAAARAVLDAVLTGPWSPGLRARYLASFLHATLRLHRYAFGVRMYESHPDLARHGGVEMFQTLARLYGECGRPGDGVRCLRYAESLSAAGSGADLERLVCQVAVFAFAGAVEAVEERLAAQARLAAALPAPFAPYWRGVASLARGDHARAQTEFDEAAHVAAPAQAEMWRQAIAGRWTQAVDLERAATQVQMEQAAELALVREQVRHRPIRVAAPFSRGLAPVTAVLLAANVIVWLLLEILGSSTDIHTLILFGANVPADYAGHQYWRLIASMFLHIGFWHLFFNGYALYLFGTFIERWCGRAAMFSIYMLSGIAGSAASSFLANHAISAGASGAIFGLLGTGIVLVLRFKERLSPTQRWMYASNLIVIAAVQLVFGAIEKGMDNHAHAGGFITGMALGLLVNRGAFPRVARVMAVALVGVLAWTGYEATNSVLGLSTPRPRPTLRRYIDATHDLQIRVPVRWTARPLPSGESVFTDVDGAAGLIIRVHQSYHELWTPARVEKELEGERLALLLDNLRLPSGAGQWTGLMLPYEPMRIGGRTFYHRLLTFTGKNSEEAEIHDRYYAFWNECLYEFEFGCAEPTYSLYLPVFRQMLASFRPLSDLIHGPPEPGRPAPPPDEELPALP